jgi:hypothetical protein
MIVIAANRTDIHEVFAVTRFNCEKWQYEE